jgi:hypothetical protein
MARSDPHETCVRTDQLQRRPRSVSVPRQQSALPDDAVAIIEPPSRSVTQAGKARDRAWLLRFQPRGLAFADPLTGWTGSDDPLAHLALRFPTREAAIRYAERQGLAYQLREPGRIGSDTGGEQGTGQQQPLWICCWPAGPHALCCGEYPLLKERGSDVG